MTKTFTVKVDWLWFFIFLVPTFYVFGRELRSAQADFFQVMIISLIAVMHVNKFFGLFLGYCLAQSFLLPTSDLQTTYITNLTFAAVAYHFIVKYTFVEDFKKYFTAFYLLLGLNLVWCVFQIFQVDPLFSMLNADKQKIFTEFSGLFALPAFLGNFAAAILPLGFTLSWTLFPLVLVAIYFSKSTFSILAAFIAALFFFWFYKRIVFWAIVLFGGLFMLVYILKYDAPTGQFSRRLKVWSVVTKIALQKQFLGRGLASYKENIWGEATPSHNIIVMPNNSARLIKPFLINEAMAKGKNELAQKLSQISDDSFNLGTVQPIIQSYDIDFMDWKNAHNEFLEIFYETGFFGLLFIFGYIYDIFKRFFTYGQKHLPSLVMVSSFLAILVVTAGHFPFHLARLSAPFLVLMAFTEIALLAAQKKSEAI